MAVTVEIESVVTEDSHPESAPFRISAQSGKSTLTFVFKVVADGVIRAWRARFQPTDRNHGQVIAKQGIVCGAGDRCGPNARSLAVAGELTREEELDESEVHGHADGDYPVEVFAMEEGAWN